MNSENRPLSLFLINLQVCPNVGLKNGFCQDSRSDWFNLIGEVLQPNCIFKDDWAKAKLGEGYRQFRK
jgi:N6-adenosine-specific RNA methylase IME4